MEKISLQNLPEDTFLNTQVFLDSKYILLSPDVPVTRELKERLEKWGFTDLYTDSSDGSVQEVVPVKKAASSQMIVEQNMEEEKREKETVIFYHGCLAFLNDVYDRYQLDNILRLSQISDKVKEIKNFTRDYRQNILTLPDSTIEGVSYNISHSAKTAFLALILADTLKLPIHQQIELGIAALLHRIGMIRLPPELYMINRALNPEERNNLRTYPVLSYKILKAANFPPSVLQGVLEHAERIDGKGYPQGLTGDKISLYAKIVAVTSSYTAAIAKRPYKSGRDGHSGILDLLRLSGTAYDATIVKALVLTLSVYPIGTYVELSDKSRGIVIKTDPRNPKSPYVRLITDPAGEVYPENPVLQPGLEDTPTITRALNPEEKAAAETIYKGEQD